MGNNFHGVYFFAILRRLVACCVWNENAVRFIVEMGDGRLLRGEACTLDKMEILW